MVITPVLKQLNSTFNVLVGMLDDHTVDLIITADGHLQGIPYVEQLVAEAPTLPNWKFTAHKPPMGEDPITISMGEHKFGAETLSFVVHENPPYPDEIQISVVYQPYQAAEAPLIQNGVLIFLDNYLGEIRSVSSLDQLDIVGPDQVEGERIPIEKLPDYLIWREKEFVEKYDGVRYDTEQDNYISMEAQTQEGLPILAIMNQALLTWDAKASHPWMVCLDIPYDGSKQNGMPHENRLEEMNRFEDQLTEELKDFAGYLNIGRTTGNNSRTIYFAVKDFRTPVLVIDQTKAAFPNLQVQMEMFKDKYWRSLEYYTQAVIDG